MNIYKGITQNGNKVIGQLLIHHDSGRAFIITGLTTYYNKSGELRIGNMEYDEIIKEKLVEYRDSK